MTTALYSMAGLGSLEESKAFKELKEREKSDQNLSGESHRLDDAGDTEGDGDNVAKLEKEAGIKGCQRKDYSQ